MAGWLVLLASSLVSNLLEMADFLFWSIHQKLAAHVLQWNCQQHTNGGKRMAYLYICVCVCVYVCVCVWKQCYKNHSWQHETHTETNNNLYERTKKLNNLWHTEMTPQVMNIHDNQSWYVCNSWVHSRSHLISSPLLSSPLLSSSSSCTSPPPLLFTRCNPMCSKGILPYTKKIATPTTIHKVFNVVCFTRLLV